MALTPAQIAANRQRAANRRRTSRQVKAGTFEPSAIGKKSREIANVEKFWTDPEGYAEKGFRPKNLEPTPAQRRKLETLLVRRMVRKLGDRSFDQVFVQAGIAELSTDHLIIGLGSNEQDLEDYARPQNESQPHLSPFYDVMGHDRKGKSKLYRSNPWWYHGDYRSAGE